MDRTERQEREIDYHREHAKTNAALLQQYMSYDVLFGRRWWNAYWEMFYAIRKNGVQGKRVLVVGCGFGDDAVRIARLGADVDAFDLSPDLLNIARQIGRREVARVRFHELPAEALTFDDATFDVVVARDILHHCDVPKTLAEMRRVSKPGALWVVNEIYSHSITEVVRRSWLVENMLYGAMRRFIYGSDKPYITEDERKLNESEISAVLENLSATTRYFNFLVTRVIPDKWSAMAKVDRALLMALKPFARYLAGRALIVGRVERRKR